MRRGLSAWCVALPLAVVGSQVAHSADYRIIESGAGARARLLETTGHHYMSFLPLVLALLSVVVALALVSEARQTRSRSNRGLAAWHFGLICPLVFACQELFERLAYDGSLHWNALLQSTFLLGLALQLPFALLAFAIAWLLLRAARGIGHFFARRLHHRRLVAARIVSWRGVDVPRLPVLARGFGTRGPPFAFAA